MGTMSKIDKEIAERMGDTEEVLERIEKAKKDKDKLAYIRLDKNTKWYSLLELKEGVFYATSVRKGDSYQVKNGRLFVKGKRKNDTWIEAGNSVFFPNVKQFKEITKPEYHIKFNELQDGEYYEGQDGEIYQVDGEQLLIRIGHNRYASVENVEQVFQKFRLIEM